MSDFVDIIKALENGYYDLQRLFVVTDNLNTYQSEGLVRVVADGSAIW